MKKIGILFFMLGISLQAQQVIEISKGYNAIVMFNSDIVGEPSIGNEDEYLFSSISDRVIELKIDGDASPSRGTSLTVTTKDGMLYLFNINLKSNSSIKIIEADPKLAKNINSDYQNIVSSASADDENEVSPSSKINESSSEDTQYNKVIENCKRNENRKKRVFTTPHKSNNIIFTVRDIAYKNKKLYLFFDVKNKGGQSYDVEWVHLKYTTTIEEDGTDQIKLLTPYYIHNQPKIINGKSKYSFIVVLDKTAINKYKQVSIDIQELGGERNLSLKINDNIINNPIQL